MTMYLVVSMTLSLTMIKQRGQGATGGQDLLLSQLVEQQS